VPNFLGFVNPAKLNNEPDSTTIAWDDFDDSDISHILENSKSSSTSAIALEESLIAGGGAEVEGEVESWYEGSIVVSEDGSLEFEEGLFLESTSAQVYPPSRLDHSPNHTTQVYPPSQHFPSRSHITLSSVSPESGDCLRCNKSNEFDHMVQCDNTSKHENNMGWFHYSCVGLPIFTVLKDDETWFCEACKPATDFSDSPDEDVETTGDDDESVQDYTYEDTKKPSKQEMATHSRSGKIGTAGPLPSNDDRHKVIRKAPKPKAEKLAARRNASSQKPSSTKVAKAGKREKSRLWEDHEKAAAITLLGEIMDEKPIGYNTEKRWQMVTDRLMARFNINRTWAMVKNFWNRRGRSTSGIDERRNPNTERMVTGVQDPESRRKAREAKRKDRDGEDEDDEDATPRKRQKKRPNLTAASYKRAESCGLKRKKRDENENEDFDTEPISTKRQRKRPPPAPESSLREDSGSRDLKRKECEDDEEGESDAEPLVRRPHTRDPTTPDR